MNRYEKESKEMEKASFKYAWVTDNLKAERERGVSIDISLFNFSSNKYDFTVIDAPGHRDFIKNMITGTSQADVALLLVDATTFEVGMGKDGQTREHALLAHTLGVHQIVVAVNKMDDALVNYSQERYETIKSEVQAYLKTIGYKAVLKIPFIPISGWLGENLTTKSNAMSSWYDGPCLLDALDHYVTPPKRPVDKPLRIPIQNAYRIGGVGTVPIGRVETGIAKPGMRVLFAPSGQTSQIQSLEIHRQLVDEAIPGDNVGFHVKHISVHQIGRGHVASDATNQPATAVSSFEAQLMVINHPGSISVGYSPIIDCHTAHVGCVVSRIKEKRSIKDGKEVVEKDPESVQNGDTCIVELQPTKPMCVETFAEFPPLGRFSVRDMRQTVAVGIIKSITREEN